MSEEIHHMLVLSTSHISKQDDDTLQVRPGLLPPSGVVYLLGDGCGYLLALDEEMLDTPYEENTWSPGLRGVHQLAIKLGCTYVRLDPDGPVHADLKTYKW